jgi:hypothetical protein
MPETKKFRLEVLMNNGSRMETTFEQTLPDGSMPAARFYLGYSNDNAPKQDLPWIAVGDIAYSPEEAIGVKIVPVVEAAKPRTLRSASSR